MKISRPFLFVAAFIVVLTVFRLWLWHERSDLLPNDPEEDASNYKKEYTVVINAYRRDDFLRESIKHYGQCGRVAWIYVIWNDIERSIPPSLAMNHTIVMQHLEPNVTVKDLIDKRGRLVYFVDKRNVISNRFRPRPFATEAVFSVDDDMLYDCDTMASGHDAWLRLAFGKTLNKNSRGLITDDPIERESKRIRIGLGFAPRKILLQNYMSIEDYRKSKLFDSSDDPKMGQRRIRYYKPNAAYVTGFHNTIFVTKGAFLPHTVYEEYFDKKWSDMRDLVDEHTTGEDILMSGVCWQNKIRLVPAHYHNIFSKFYHMFEEKRLKHDHISLSQRTKQWRPLVLSRLIETLLNINEWDNVSEIPPSFAYMSDLWQVNWWNGFSDTRLGGWLRNLQRLILFDGRYLGWY